LSIPEQIQVYERGGEKLYVRLQEKFGDELDDELENMAEDFSMFEDMISLLHREFNEPGKRAARFLKRQKWIRSL
jgi:hypothetical protein